MNVREVTLIRFSVNDSIMHNTQNTVVLERIILMIIITAKNMGFFEGISGPHPRPLSHKWARGDYV